jgi:hypothetical protein
VYYRAISIWGNEQARYEEERMGRPADGMGWSAQSTKEGEEGGGCTSWIGFMEREEEDMVMMKTGKELTEEKMVDRR